MRKSVVVLALVAALPVLVASAPRDDKIPAATPAGKVESCIPIRQIRASHVRSDRVIDFETTGRRVYRNTLPQSCPGLNVERRFAYETSLSQLCSVDIITVLYIGGGPTRGASCGLGEFQPVTLAKR